MKTNNKIKLKDLSIQVMIATIYAVATILLAPISYGELQIRISETLLILVLFNKKHMLGLTIGCLISNFFSPMMFLDVPFGTLATLLSLNIIYYFKTKPYNDDEGMIHMTLISVKDGKYMVHSFDLEGFKKGIETGENHHHHDESNIAKIGNITINTVAKKVQSVKTVVETIKNSNFKLSSLNNNFTITGSDYKVELLENGVIAKEKDGVIYIKLIVKDEVPYTKWIKLTGLEKNLEAVEQHHHNHDDEHAIVHYWTSPENIIKAIKGVAEKLGQLIPDKKDIFLENSNHYISKIQEEVNSFKAYLDKLPSDVKNKELLYIGHDAMGAFANEFNIKIKPISLTLQHDSQLKPDELKSFKAEIEENKTKVVFKPELNEAIDIEKKLKDSIKTLEFKVLSGYHNVSDKEFKDGVTYLDLLKLNISNLKLELK